MPNEKVKEKLIQATVKLLNQSSNPGKITARQIASEADVNLAMINYYFKSKDELVNRAVSKIIEERADTLKDIMCKDIPAKQKLMEFLITMADIVIEYADITRPSIPYLLLEAEISTPYYILPVIRECYDNKKSETECRIVAYQLISSLQLFLYRSADFYKYTGIDVKDKKQRDQSLHSIADILIGG